ncbi:nucleotidyltransferase domain-containing protein [Microaerobacter geothermalis]|uniref:nucleotidyltransferase family protein n=1 Tax=Microaerobacter geothermalis TaxID=674972 RepID=UPI001F3DE88C|nr:nucleotidyltransferase domain-containing protein [Microaerobacter geothermalis]MCF6093417.1 nucleotidyltransferase domain-containing protein [Microaerobacter geothermalis]
MRRDLILNQVKEILSKHLHHLPVRVYLFGSWAKNEEKRSSDIDIAIWYKQPLPENTLFKIREAFEESAIPYKVDVVDLVEAAPYLSEKVFKEGIEWNV